MIECPTFKHDGISLMNCDNMAFMRTVKDKAYNLAIVDPPYGIGENWKKDRHSQFYKHNSSYNNKQIPTAAYFEELFRISKNQIIWGANYYTDYLPARNSWIVWDKKKDFESCNMAEGELAWHSYNVPLRFIRAIWNGFMTSEPRHGKHPHEKPAGLYRWLLLKYAEKGDKIFDSHLGSASIALACHDLGFELDACEIDETYFADSVERFKAHTAQLKITV